MPGHRVAQVDDFLSKVLVDALPLQVSLRLREQHQHKIFEFGRFRLLDKLLLRQRQQTP